MCNLADVKRFPMLPINDVMFLILDVDVREIYSHVYALPGNVKFAQKTSGCNLCTQVLDWHLEMFLQLYYI